MSVEAKLTRISSDLKLNNLNTSAGPAKQVQTLPDSWDDEIDDDAPEAPGPTLKQIASIDRDDPPPPPTPASPFDRVRPADAWARPSPSNGDKRPEKSTATANRLIAGALGIKAPPKTPEQKQYEAAVRENERKRREKEKLDHEKQRLDSEKAKTAVWDS